MPRRPPAAAAAAADHSAELQSLVRQVKANLVFVAGGDFLMGDFGEDYGPEKIQLDTKDDSKPLHGITPLPQRRGLQPGA